jgi:hypothetical protein
VLDLTWLTLALPLLHLVPQVGVLPVSSNGDDVRRALVECEISIKEACYRMQISAAEFSRMLNHRGCNVARLEMLGPEFMAAYLRRVYQRTTGKSLAAAQADDPRIAKLETQLEALWTRLMGRRAS